MSTAVSFTVGTPGRPGLSGAATALRGLGCERVLSFASLALVPALQSLTRGVHSKTRPREPDAKTQLRGSSQSAFWSEEAPEGPERNPIPTSSWWWF